MSFSTFIRISFYQYSTNRLKCLPEVLPNDILYVINVRLFNKAKVISERLLFRS